MKCLFITADGLEAIADGPDKIERYYSRAFGPVLSMERCAYASEDGMAIAARRYEYYGMAERYGRMLKVFEEVQ